MRAGDSAYIAHTGRLFQRVRYLGQQSSRMARADEIRTALPLVCKVFGQTLKAFSEVEQLGANLRRGCVFGETAHFSGRCSVSRRSIASALHILPMAPSTCAAVVEAIRVAWAGRPDGYAKAATPVTSAQV